MNVVYCSWQRNAAFSVANDQWHNIHDYDTENYDPLVMLETGRHMDVVIPEDGVYHLSAKITWESNDSGQRLARFIKDRETLNDDTGTVDRDATAGIDYVIHNWPSFLRKGRTVTLQLKQTSGQTLNAEMIQFKVTKISG